MPTAVTSITDGQDDGTGTSSVFDQLDGANDITTVKIGESTYALVTAFNESGVQIIDISNPAVPTAASSISDGAIFDTLGGADDITTVKIGQSTYALVAAFEDDGIQIIDITDPTMPTAVSSITDGQDDGTGN